MTLLCYTFGTTSPASLESFLFLAWSSTKAFFFLAWSSTNCLPLSFGSGEGVCLRDSGEDHEKASPALGVELIVGGAGGIVNVPTTDLGIARDCAPLQGVVGFDRI